MRACVALFASPVNFGSSSPEEDENVVRSEGYSVSVACFINIFLCASRPCHLDFFSNTCSGHAALGVAREQVLVFQSQHLCRMSLGISSCHPVVSALCPVVSALCPVV